MDHSSNKKLLLVTYLLTILFALHVSIPLYATSSFLHQFIPTHTISLLYMLGGTASFLLSIKIAKYLKRFHTFKFTATLAILEMVLLGAFGFSQTPIFLGVLFVAHFALQSLLYTCLNIYVEIYSSHKEAGAIRGIFLTVYNTGALISPLFGGFILSNYSFSAVYLTAAATLIPYIYLIKKYLSHVPEPVYSSVDVFQALRDSLHNKNLRGILICSLMIECFYAVMIVYSPIYLTSLGIPLSTYLFSILPFALTPFVILPYELGLLADTKFGEKEILIGGLLLVTLSLFTVVTITTTNPLVWTCILFISRIGAACVETMTFTYFFKKVDRKQASLTALFSSTRPIASVIVGVIIALLSPLLITMPGLIFIVTGCATLWCISYVLPIKDTL